MRPKTTATAGILAHFLYTMLLSSVLALNAPVMADSDTPTPSEQTVKKEQCSPSLLRRLVRYSLRTAFVGVTAAGVGLGAYLNSGDEIGLPAPTKQQAELLNRRLVDIQSYEELDSAIDALTPRATQFFLASSDLTGRYFYLLLNAIGGGGPPKNPTKEEEKQKDELIKNGRWAAFQTYLFKHSKDRVFIKNYTDALKEAGLPFIVLEPPSDLPPPSYEQLHTVLKKTLKGVIHESIRKRLGRDEAEASGPIPEGAFQPSETLSELITSELGADSVSDKLTMDRVIPGRQEYRRAEIEAKLQEQYDKVKKWFSSEEEADLQQQLLREL